MRKSILWLVLVCQMGLAAPIDGFPPDPPGTVLDRVYETVMLGSSEHSLYASVVRPSGKKPTMVVIYQGTGTPRGMEWKKLYTWQLADGGMQHNVSRAVLKVAAHGDDEVQFWFQQWFRYVEGRGTLVLHYYPKTGKFEPHISD